MIKYTMAEKLFVAPIRELFSQDYFGYSVIHEAKYDRSYDMCFTMNLRGYPSSFKSELIRHGIKADMGMLNFKISDRSQGGSNIEMCMSNARKRNGRRPVVAFDCCATGLLLKSFKTESVYEIKEYLIDMIQEALAER